MFSFNLEGQYIFDFENDSCGTGGFGQLASWSQVPAGRWCCDSLTPISGVFSLHHCFDNPEAGCDFLLLRHPPLNLSDSFAVDFRLRHGYPPSSQNNWQLAILAELQEGIIIHGIVVGVNFKGSDDTLKVWGVHYGVVEEWLVSSLNYEEQVGEELAPLLRLSWDGSGKLDLYISLNPKDEEAYLLGSCYPSRLPGGRELILRYRYSSSRDQALWMDELELDGSFEWDTLAPTLLAVTVEDAYTIALSFSEAVLSPDPASFRLYSENDSAGIVPDSLWKLEDEILLVFPNILPNRLPLRLRMEHIEDLEGNRMADTLVSLMRNAAGWGDLVFNEVMADPDPSVRYEEEYLELFNRSAFELDLEGWLVRVNDRSYLATDSALIILPGDFVLLKGIILPNDGATLSLFSRENRLVHAATYSRPWDAPNWKKEGGWSLESPDPDRLCRISANWEYSTDPGGGTPGRANSSLTILEDGEPPVLLYAGSGEAGGFLLHYSEPLVISEGEEVGFFLHPGQLKPDSLGVLAPLSEVLYLSFPEDPHSWSRYRLSLPGLMDCEGNLSDAVELQAGAITQVFPSSVLISELMYDPDEGSTEFVELFLPGEGVFDLRDLAIQFVEEGEVPGEPVALSLSSRLILPGQYLVLTSSEPHLRTAYGLEVSGQWVEVEGLPGLNNSSGRVYLTDRAGNVVDRMNYSDEMHMELLNDPRGVSLERISWDRPGSEAGNWHSAASVAGYATPGRKNSQALAEDSAAGLLHVDPEVFSPDNDGYRDLLTIQLSPGRQDWVLGLWITDLQGNLIRELANNHLAGPSVQYTWDGEDENGTMQPMGFYVIYARGYHPATGESWVRRKGIGLVYR